MATKKLILIILLFSLQAQAHERALFEWGGFVGHGNTADYPASNEYRLRTLPVPYVRYRGDIFRTDDEDGTRFRMLSLHNFDLDFSFGGSFPTEGDNNQARLGMPNLDWTLEVGPRLLYYFLRSDKVTVRAGLPLRYSFSTTTFTTWKQVGSIFAPTLQFDFYHVGTENLNLYLMSDFNYYNEGEANYFFEVDPQYQTADRAAYNAVAGYVGYNLSAAAKYEIGKANFILGSRYSDYSDSANSQSPLHKTSVNWTYFVGFGWVFFESEQRELKWR
jgi:hypothetical protein